MKKLISALVLAVFLTTTVTEARTANQVYRMGTSGGSPRWGALNLASSSAVTGALPIANGGTGQITQSAGFNALSPMTTQGDVIYGGASGTGTRLPGATTNGHVLKYNTGTSAPEWATDYGNYQSTDWASYSLVIGATTTPPTEGAGAVKSAMWRRQGQNMEIMFSYSQTAAGTAGSGDYLFPIPAGYAIDTTKISASTTATGATGNIVGYGKFGSTDAVNTTTNTGGASVIVYNSTNLVVNVHSATAGVVRRVGSVYGDLTQNPHYLSFVASVPISGWTSTGSDSEVYVTGQLANASTNTRVVYFSSGTVQVNRGTAITYAASSTLGDTYTINESGLYSIDVSGMGSAVVLGVSVDATGFLSTTINNNGFNYSQGHRGVNTAGSYFSRTLRLYAGQVLRVQTDGGAFGAGTISGMVNINKVGGASSGSPIIAKYSISSPKTCDTSTPCNYDTLVIDTNSAVTTGAGWKFTAPAAKVYEICIKGGITSGGEFFRLYIGGSADEGIQVMTATNGMTYGCVLKSLTSGQQIDVRPNSSRTISDAVATGGSFNVITIKSVN